jgi:amino acid adenylation domain-containing protein
VTFGNEKLSYAELSAQSSLLAHRLRKQGVGPDALVGVYLERSAQAIVALVAILRAGGAYLPLDPAYPTERLTTILEDAKPTVLLTEKQMLDKVPSGAAIVICLDQLTDSNSSGETGGFEPGSGLDHLAYVIYTSGSTGNPKGVMVTHANVARLLSSTSHWFSFNENDVWTLFHSLAFDFSVWEIWGCLLNGGRLVVVPFSVSRSPQEFHELLVRERVTVLNQTPSAFYQLISEDQAQRSTSLALRVVVFGGEALNFRALRPWFAAHGDRLPRLINMYGITETTVHVTYRELNSSDAENGGNSLIGVAIPDLRIHLLDENRRPVSTGEVGEIYVAGAGIARGYLNRPDLNAERFVADTFSGIPGARLYRSGDLARYLPTGELEYLGRGDAQVKIQGFRIELGEIEAAIMGHAQIQEARVVPHTDTTGTKRLVAYYVPRDGAELNARLLSTHLSTKLPPWMIPSAYLQVQTFPLTSNGKLDCNALPDPVLGSSATGPEPAGTEIEKQVAAVWRDVLGAKHVSLDDNFFDIGGTSLLLVSVHQRLQALFGKRISIADLFASTTVRSLAERLGSSTSNSEQSRQIEDQAEKQRAAFARARALRKTAP